MDELNYILSILPAIAGVSALVRLALYLEDLKSYRIEDSMTKQQVKSVLLVVFACIMFVIQLCI